jgi:hypothetical protein
MSEMEYDTWDDFVDEWHVDGLNVPVSLYFSKREKVCTITFAQPRKMRMIECCVSNVDGKTLARWWKENSKKVETNVFGDTP